MTTRLHRNWLLRESGWESTPRLEAELDFLENEGLLLTDDEFLRRQAAGESLDPFPLTGPKPLH